ncbi:RusA family crossover junction endodeoxyribonuclease [Limosilactobacillus pontis]|uniref:RusA family crossover junction endodeoxyribonuclease n=1 Tax=Limosilactobacillus pontis TaxID=35787 RepID=A0ABU7SUR8_9LACO
MIKLTFDFPPVAQARPRATRFGRGIRLYDLEPVHVYKKQLAESARFMYKGELLTGPLKVTIRFYREIQRSESKKRHRLKAQGAIRPTKKPDLDNYIKSTLDGLNGVLWTDDNEIVELHTGKYYSDQPRVEIEVEEEKEAEE